MYFNLPIQHYFDPTGPSFGAPEGPKRPSFCSKLAFLGPHLFGTPRWLVLGRKWIKLIGHMGCDLWDTYMALIWYPRWPSFGTLDGPCHISVHLVASKRPTFGSK